MNTICIPYLAERATDLNKWLPFPFFTFPCTSAHTGTLSQEKRVAQQPRPVRNQVWGKGVRFPAEE